VTAIQALGSSWRGGNEWATAVNECAALANATVGIAMGGAGTDVALETADVALMGDDLSKLPFEVGLGRANARHHPAEPALRLGVIALLIVHRSPVGSASGIAVIFTRGSTIVVALNALRLLSFRNTHDQSAKPGRFIVYTRPCMTPSCVRSDTARAGRAIERFASCRLVSASDFRRGHGA